MAARRATGAQYAGRPVRAQWGRAKDVRAPQWYSSVRSVWWFIDTQMVHPLSGPCRERSRKGEMKDARCSAQAGARTKRDHGQSAQELSPVRSCASNQRCSLAAIQIRITLSVGVLDAVQCHAPRHVRGHGSVVIRQIERGAKRGHVSVDGQRCSSPGARLECGLMTTGGQQDPGAKPRRACGSTWVNVRRRPY